MAAPAAPVREPIVLPPKPEAPALYWLGVTLDAPVHCLHLAGIEFMRFHQRPVPRQDKPDISTLTGPYRGNYKHLDADQVLRIREAAKTRIVRWGTPARDDKTGEIVISKETGKPVRRGRIHDVRGGHETKFRPEPGDEPIGKYFFMVHVSEIDKESLIPGATPKEPKTFSEMYPERNVA